MACPLLVSVIDDDESVRDALPDLLRAFGFAAATFSSAEEFMQSETILLTNCLVLDVSLPGISGPDLQRELAESRIYIPIVFITAHEDEAIRSSVLEAGAIEYLLKPFGNAALLRAVRQALRPR